MLQCQHTFCCACLEASFQSRDQKSAEGDDFIHCPTCNERHEFVSSPGKIADLPSNVYIDSMIRVINQQENNQKNSNSSTFSKVPVAAKEPKTKCSRCETIADIVMQNCDHCQQTLCAICWHAHMNELIVQVQQLDVQLNLAKEKMDHKMIDYKKRFIEMDTCVKDYFAERVAQLTKHEQSLLDESQKMLNDGLCAHELVVHKIRCLRRQIGDNTVAGAHGNLVQLFLNLHKEISIVFEEISHWGEETILFDKKHVKIDVINVPSHGNSPKEVEPKKDIHVERLPLNSHDGVYNFYKNHCFKTKLRWTKCHRPVGVGMAPWSNDRQKSPQLYIAGAESKMVFVINKVNGDIVQRISHDDMVYPNGIAFDPASKELFVSDKWKHCIFVFSSNGTYLRQLCSKGNLEGYLRAPEGITVAPNGTLFVCDTGNDRVQCLDPVTGYMFSQFGRILKDQLLKGTARYVDLKCPTGVAIFNDEVVVLDSGNRRVKTFTTDGEKILEFGQAGSLVGQFQYPEVVAVDQSGFILVGDGGNARISIYRPNGQFVRAVGSRGDSPGKFNWISGLYVSKNREIIACDYKNHSVQVLE
ncbi:uncharacterized protein LOC129752873 [Uranotaenia lowii]|uniref:uncharacterized protein LOC129752873 n=1 Tax=Uranotaenia lowii TaxID=190385 RepID=UPI002478BF24|nr:uncharacterized protein LOC129752873 [Uranotaenia lowii]